MVDFLNHFVAARLMTDAARFERIEQLEQDNHRLGRATPATPLRPRTVSLRDGHRNTEQLSRPCTPGDGACEARTLNAASALTR